MFPLDTLSQQRWSLDAFVDQANALLPAYLPSDPINSRVKGAVNARLIRHYTGEGLLDEPLKQGREARYRYRHLLQLLVVRRLLAEGLSAGAIGDLVRKKGEGELEGILEGGATVQVTATLAAPGQSALDFLADLRAGNAPTPAAPILRKRRASSATDTPATTPTDIGGSAADPQPAAHRGTGNPSAASWERHPITDGIELHIRSDFRVPDSPKARHNLLTLIEQRLKRRGRP